MAIVKKTVDIPVDDTYHLSVDNQQWTIVKTRAVKDKDSKNFGSTYETPVGYHHDLGKALNGIIKDMTTDGRGNVDSLKAYLAWHEATIHSLLDRVLRHKEELQEALELNKVI